MHTTLWWYRLHFWQWIQAGRARPLRRAIALLGWWLPCLIGPLVLLFAGASASSAALNFLLSLDVPLTLLLAGATALDALGVESRAAAEGWISPLLFRTASHRWMSRQRWLCVARWPAGFAAAAFLLARGASSRPESLAEMLLMALVAFACGASFAWAMQRPAPEQQQPVGSHRLQGVSALSWVALRDARDRFNPRRAALLAVPALLAAPLGAAVSQVVMMLSLWLPAVFMLIVCREAALVNRALYRWLRVSHRAQRRLAFWVWRYIAVGIVAIAALAVVWLKFGTAAAVRHR